MVEVGRIRLDPGLRDHVDSCPSCWSVLLASRWKVAERSESFADLRDFLGSEFQYGIDSSWLLVDDWNSRPRDTPEEIAAFYRETPWYLYNLVLWDASGQRPPYVTMAEAVI